MKPEDILGVANADNVEISGIVTLFNSITDFEVGGIAVQTDGATEYNDILPEDIDVGSKAYRKRVSDRPGAAGRFGAFRRFR